MLVSNVPGAVAFTCELVKQNKLPNEIRKHFSSLIDPKRGQHALALCELAISLGIHGIELIEQCIDHREWESYMKVEFLPIYRKIMSKLNSFKQTKTVKSVQQFIYCSKFE